MARNAGPGREEGGMGGWGDGSCPALPGCVGLRRVETKREREREMGRERER